MTSATLYREGNDLEELLAALDDEHPGRVRVVEVTYPREGGVFGFFARQRVGVHYELSGAPDGVATAGPDRDAHPLADLISAAEAAEAVPARASDPARSRASDAVPSGASDAAPANLEFAQMLLELAARKAADRPEPTDAPVAPATPPASRPTSQAAGTVPGGAEGRTPWIYRRPEQSTVAPAAEVPAAGTPDVAGRVADPAPTREPERSAEDSRARLTLRRRLAEVGVPIDWVPADGGDAYRVVEQLVNRLPAAPEPPTGAGDLLVIAGPAAPALRSAETMRARMRLRPENVWAAGCPAGSVPHERTIEDPWQAAIVAAEVRLSGRGPTIVVVATDDDDSEELGHERWAADVVRALSPEALWAVVDATRKPSDTRTRLRSLGAPTGLVITAAARTASPASVWELDVPAALIDGRPATRGAWAVLLIDKLAEPEW